MRPINLISNFGLTAFITALIEFVVSRLTINAEVEELITSFSNFLEALDGKSSELRNPMHG